ncbi:O-antigen ligase family protein [Microvirga aerophila]|uniref:O-antigen polymerase n=1 Tax=Microvirga aerophila TaxID=670291 RepID=A0A512BNK9_9HYPH|nr:O-antigen ligase family protein [Microvirga aerophila]GEO13495.1 O-antigen polymerase [Microvirga aerophila]
MNAIGTVSIGSPASVRRLQAAEMLWRVALGGLAVMPLAMAVAHRSTPLFLGVSALSALGATALEGRFRQLVRESASALFRPTGIAVLAFLALSVISISWSQFNDISIQALGEFWLPIAGAFILCQVLPKRMTRQAFWMLAGSVAAACLLIIVELETGLTLRRSLGMRADSFIFNRPSLTLLVLLPPLLVWLVTQIPRGWAVALAILVLVGAAVARSDSGAAGLGLIVMGLAFVSAWASVRATAIVMAAGFVAAMAMAPFLGPISESLIPPAVHKALAGGHSRERVAVWQSFGAAVRVQPGLGAGFGMSPRMRKSKIVWKVPKEHRRFLGIGHPHNLPLQIWTELGMVGAVLALAIVLLVIRAICRQSRLVASTSLALLAAAGAVALVGHGAWQGWWAASLGASVAWMLATCRTRLETRP